MVVMTVCFHIVNHGAFVYRLGQWVFSPLRAVRLRYALPSFAPGVMEALQVSIERYTREAMRGVQGSIPCGAIKFCKCVSIW